MFVVSKLSEALLQPLNTLLMALILAAILLYTRHVAWGRRILVGAAATLLVLAVLPWDQILISPLEERFLPPQRQQRIDGVVVLGGAIDPVVSAARRQPSLNSAAERLTAVVELGRLYPQARFIYSGGSGSVLHPDEKEAPVAKVFLASLGFDTARVVFEGQSRNTWENAVFSRELMQPKVDETWLLVTSAMHMPRAIGAFRAAGWTITAYPVDYLTAGETDGLRFNVMAGLGAVSTALHEWIGLAYYRLRGWSDALYPAPTSRL